MSDSLCVRCDQIMLLGSQIDDVGIEAREYSLEQRKSLLRGAMLDQREGLPLGINFRSVERMAGDDLDVFRQICLKSSYLDLLTGSLSSDNGALLRGCFYVSTRIAGLYHKAYKVHIR